MTDQRKNQRFELRLPVELLRSGAQPVDQLGETVNLSSGGVLFQSDAPVEIGQPIEFMITLPTGNKGTAVRLKCVGKVVRTEIAESSSVAATLERFEFVRVAKARAS
ncbi:MAG: PilZ domain-containing protein [Bryobacterales bacterium]|nr:PilZ domain-containing protein [Bryobacterales bacterium]